VPDAVTASWILALAQSRRAIVSGQERRHGPESPKSFARRGFLKREPEAAADCRKTLANQQAGASQGR